MEIHTLIQKSEGIGQRSGKLWKFIPTCKDCTPGAFMFKKRMESRIQEISSRLEDIARNGNALKLSQSVRGTSNQVINRLPSTSIIEPNVYGRDKDTEEVSKLMMSNHENVSVIPIVGMGGIGKTTLAQLIYNDVVMGAGFNLKVWVCVSDFDVFTITKIIFHYVTKYSAESKDLNMLLSLREKFSKNKFLVILDDLWNEDYSKWDALRCPFLVGLAGNKVLVTTRDDRIASMVGSVPCYYLKVLADGDCLSLLAQHALEKSDF